MISGERPIVAAVHPNLIMELKYRKEMIEKETQRPTKGGLTIFSKLAAEELRLSRETGDKLIRNIFSMKNINTYKFELNKEPIDFVKLDDFKKLYIYSTALSKRKDQQQIRLEIQKIKGLKKNEIKFLW